MTSIRHLILDEGGKVVNVILVDDPFPEGYWPGYGRYIVCCFGEPETTPPLAHEIRTGANPFTYLTVRPQSRCEMGDTFNNATGEVTPAPLPEPTFEEPEA